MGLCPVNSKASPYSYRGKYGQAMYNSGVVEIGVVCSQKPGFWAYFTNIFEITIGVLNGN